MTVSANAKVNLTLEVFGKRPDGYHALRSLVVPISLADTLDIESTDDGSITSDTGFPDDLCVKAARVLANAAGRRAKGEGRTVESSDLQPSTFNLQPALGARIRVAKRIPIGGGLGGGSADAAATLRALNELWRLRKTPEALAEIGAAVGSDVPALVLAQHYRCPVLMEGRGEKVVPLVSSSTPTFSLNLILSNPGVFSSTKEVYGICTPRLADGPSATETMIAAWESGRLGEVAAALQNDLQEPAVRLAPAIVEALAALTAAGATGVMMSGSGASVFGLVPDEQAAKRLADELNAKGLASWPVHTLIPNP